MPHVSAPLPPYCVRISPRAKRVRLVVAPGSGLTVITPKGFDPSLVPGIVCDRLEWVHHHLERLAANETSAPPDRVELRAVDQVFAVRYRTGQARSVRVRRCGPASLEISGDIGRRDLVDAALRAWLKREARRLLPPFLANKAKRFGLEYASVTVRLQRTRWGSCSAKKGISLNAKLLFLPPELARYVLAHELAHTKHLNHSAKYWRFLESLDPCARALDLALRDARQYVPAWANE